MSLELELAEEDVGCRDNTLSEVHLLLEFRDDRQRDDVFIQGERTSEPLAKKGEKRGILNR